MTVRLLTLYLDADVYKRLAQALRVRGYDVISAVELGKRDMADGEQLGMRPRNVQRSNEVAG